MRVGAPGKPKDPFSAALEALRDQLRNGRLVSGEPLTITDLAHDLGLSATPVREALSRLAGERLIEDRRGRGYFAPRLDVSDVVELYGLRRLYLAEALAESGEAVPLSPPEAPDPALSSCAQLGQFLDWIVARAGNRALFDAYRQVGERLASCVRVEPEVFPLSEEVAGLREALLERDRLAVALERMHDERRRHAPDVVRAMRAGANIASL
ncbi:GntR family transcriptional regulator [Caulobacter segnis]|uniref:GntR family transcriptional regulator n=1 Tax=Caulobacter segnis TaxID=88688 RepID=UPI0028570BD7|nr:GntR family transcriptional regulator [Caulobacter segnis]MDR6624485.1 DNA-binding GntR family transcriptional regulator [Caulobacter segnis]